MLEKLKNTLDKSIATVSVKSEVLVENSKIKNQIANLERERAQHIIRMGEAMYEMWRSNRFSRETFQQLCQSIHACDEGIAEQNRRLEQLKIEEQQILGTQQPAAPQPSAAPQAAQPQQAPQPSQAPQPQQPQPQAAAPQQPAAGVVCACGNLNPPGARFCTNCGKRFG